jgi:hypothetical protein
MPSSAPFSARVRSLALEVELNDELEDCLVVRAGVYIRYKDAASHGPQSGESGV